MKKKIILLFLFVLATFSGWAQSISYTSVPTSTEIGTVLTVNYQYTVASAGRISCGISLFNDWAYISFVGGNEQNPAPAGTNVTGSLSILIPSGTVPTANLTGLQNYKVILELKDASNNWLAGDYSVQNYNFTAPTLALPAISITSIPSSTQVGSDLIVNYKYTAATSGKTNIVVTKNGGANPWDFIETVGFIELDPAVSGTDVTGTFTLPIPSGTTPTASLTGNQNYRVVLELKDASNNWLAGDYSTVGYNFTAAPVVPAISITSIPSSTQVGSDLIVNYKYTAATSGKTNIVVTKNGGANPWDFIETVGFIELDPAVSGTDVTGTFTLPIPSGTTPTASLTGNQNYRVVLELKDASNNWLAGDYSTVGYNFTAAPVVPAISITSIPSSTQVGSDLIVNYKYTAATSGKTNIVVTKNGGANPWDFIETVGFIELDPAVSGTDVTGTFTLPIPSGTTPTASLTGNQNYRVVLELKDASNNWLAGDYSTVGYNFTDSTTYTYYADADGDGYGAGAAILLTASTAPTGYSVNNTDCNDSNPAINPGATEIFDTLDNDCDGDVDEGTTLGAPAVTNTGICKGTLGATPSALALPGYTLVWYKDGATTTALPSAPVITATKTFFVAQRLGSGPISPRVSVTTTVNLLPTTPAVTLTLGAETIKKVGNLIGTSTALTLTATPVGTVATDHYNWTLPTNVAQVSGGSTGTITVNFAAVAPANTALDFFVSSVSVDGCVSKTAKKLTVTRSEPAKPKALVLTDVLRPELLKITKLGEYTGALNTRTLTLTATPIDKQGSQATSYKWVLPTAATVVGGSATLVEGNTYTSTLPTISVNLANVGTETTFLFQVYGVNGNGTSLLSKDLTCSSAAPKTPGAITTPTLAKPTYNTTCNNVITVQVPSVLGATYAWNVNSGSIISGNGTNSIVINTSTAAATLTISVTASNGTGTSLPKILLLKKTACLGGKIAPESVIADEFKVIAYPNPSSSEFTIEASSKGATNVQVYDMTGRLIENRQSTSNSVQVGSRLSSGVYNVIVNQGAQVKTLRVIKR